MIQARLSPLHLEEAVKQGRLAVLNHDVPNFNLRRIAIVSSLFLFRHATKILPLTTEP